MRKKLMILLPALLVLSSCGATWSGVPSWTLRSDGHIRASQRNEDFTSSQFIEKIKSEEGKEFAFVVTPAGEAEISRHIRELEAQKTQLQNELNDCRGR